MLCDAGMHLEGGLDGLDGRSQNVLGPAGRFGDGSMDAVVCRMHAHRRIGFVSVVRIKASNDATEAD